MSLTGSRTLTGHDPVRTSDPDISNQISDFKTQDGPRTSVSTTGPPTPIPLPGHRILKTSVGSLIHTHTHNRTSDPDTPDRTQDLGVPNRTLDLSVPVRISDPVTTDQVMTANDSNPGPRRPRIPVSSTGPPSPTTKGLRSLRLDRTSPGLRTPIYPFSPRSDQTLDPVRISGPGVTDRIRTHLNLGYRWSRPDLPTRRHGQSSESEVSDRTKIPSGLRTSGPPVGSRHPSDLGSRRLQQDRHCFCVYGSCGPEGPRTPTP